MESLGPFGFWTEKYFHMSRSRWLWTSEVGPALPLNQTKAHSRPFSSPTKLGPGFHAKESSAHDLEQTGGANSIQDHHVAVLKRPESLCVPTTLPRCNLSIHYCM